MSYFEKSWSTVHPKGTTDITLPLLAVTEPGMALSARGVYWASSEHSLITRVVRSDMWGWNTYHGENKQSNYWVYYVNTCAVCTWRKMVCNINDTIFCFVTKNLAGLTRLHALSLDTLRSHDIKQLNCFPPKVNNIAKSITSEDNNALLAANVEPSPRFTSTNL